MFEPDAAWEGVTTVKKYDCCNFFQKFLKVFLSFYSGRLGEKKHVLIQRQPPQKQKYIPTYAQLLHHGMHHVSAVLRHDQQMVPTHIKMTLLSSRANRRDNEEMWNHKAGFWIQTHYAHSWLNDIQQRDQ